MSNKPKQCWKCGRLIDFRTREDGRKKWIWARDVTNGKHHKCPKIFVEAMTDFHKPVKCACGHQIYEVPIFGGLIMPFDTVQFPWRTHYCPTPDGVLPGIWNSPPEELCKKCSELKLPEPYLLVVIVCENRLAGPEPKYLVALKSACGGRFCTFFIGQGELRLGELSVLCGDGPKQRLLTNSDQIFDSDGQGKPGDVRLSHHWLDDVD